MAKNSEMDLPGDLDHEVDMMTQMLRQTIRQLVCVAYIRGQRRGMDVVGEALDRVLGKEADDGEV